MINSHVVVEVLKLLKEVLTNPELAFIDNGPIGADDSWRYSIVKPYSEAEARSSSHGGHGNWQQ